MNLVTLKGRPCRINVMRYKIDWDFVVSRPQKQVKDFLFQYWKNDLVLEEARIPGSKLRIDLWNVSRSILVEVSPAATHSFNAFFHGSKAGFQASVKRDLDKVAWAEKNNLMLVEIMDQDFPLTRTFFKDRYGIEL